ncbi:hypothetical protein VKT23_013594 [Stygiomarasmius scandens]|uniref:FHA domain-containing protein n=1 Tax=Marasmiellus scandens TaxID=2682957 RepID=A0ABR1J5N0_9AGAR
MNANANSDPTTSTPSGPFPIPSAIPATVRAPRVLPKSGQPPIPFSDLGNTVLGAPESSSAAPKALVFQPTLLDHEFAYIEPGSLFDDKFEPHIWGFLEPLPSAAPRKPREPKTPPASVLAGFFGGDPKDYGGRQDEEQEGDARMRDEVSSGHHHQDQSDSQSSQHGPLLTLVQPIQPPILGDGERRQQHRQIQPGLKNVSTMTKKLSRIDFWKVKPEYRVGRYAGESTGVGSKDMKLQRNEIVLPAMKISNLHAIFRWDGVDNLSSVVTIRDVSTNGTYLNGDLIGKGTTRILKDGDEISFGPWGCTDERQEYRFRYRFTAAGEPPSQYYTGMGADKYKR